MVAPVYQPETRCRAVYIPEGEWFDLYTGKVITGNRYILTEAPLDRIPVFLREGAIIPLGREMNFVGEVPQGLRIIDICPSRNARSGKFSLYVDDGETEQYRLGHFALIQCIIQYYTRWQVQQTQDFLWPQKRQNNDYSASLPC